MISAQRIIFISDISPPIPLAGRFFQIFILKKVGGEFFFFIVTLTTLDYIVPITLPEFHKECIATWTRLNEDNPSSSSEIANHCLISYHEGLGTSL